MAIQIPNPGTGNGATGDNEFVMWSKVRDNFSNTSHAASRLVGTNDGNVVGMTLYGMGSSGFLSNGTPSFINSDTATTNQIFSSTLAELPTTWGATEGMGGIVINRGARPLALTFGNRAELKIAHCTTAGWQPLVDVLTSANTTTDSNGFVKGASPVVNLYGNRIELNRDAEKQTITFEKLGVGNYLVKGSLGFAQEGWYIETPKDANGNVLAAVVYEQLENNDLSIKTYAKKFDMTTFSIVADLDSSIEIPEGRFISLRLHEDLIEPVVDTENVSEV